MSAFTSALISSSTSGPSNNSEVDGLDASIIVPTRRMHITLGVMSLADVPEEGKRKGKRTIEEASAFLQSIKPTLLQKIHDSDSTSDDTSNQPSSCNISGDPGPNEKLAIRFDELDVMKIERKRDLQKRYTPYQGPQSPSEADGRSERMAHVMYIAPSKEWEGYARLKRVCGQCPISWSLASLTTFLSGVDFLHEEFLKGGFIADESRALKVGLVQTGYIVCLLIVYDNLKLHCTVLNTAYRKPKRFGSRVPFSYDGIISSNAINERLLDCTKGKVITSAALETTPSKLNRSSVPVSLSIGEAPLEVYVDRVQICEMSSYDQNRDGAYKFVSEIRI